MERLIGRKVAWGHRLEHADDSILIRAGKANIPKSRNHETTAPVTIMMIGKARMIPKAKMILATANDGDDSDSTSHDRDDGNYADGDDAASSDSESDGDSDE